MTTSASGWRLYARITYTKYIFWTLPMGPVACPLDDWALRTNWYCCIAVARRGWVGCRASALVVRSVCGWVGERVCRYVWFTCFAVSLSVPIVLSYCRRSTEWLGWSVRGLRFFFFSPAVPAPRWQFCVPLVHIYSGNALHEAVRGLLTNICGVKATGSPPASHMWSQHALLFLTSAAAAAALPHPGRSTYRYSL